MSRKKEPFTQKYSKPKILFAFLSKLYYNELSLKRGKIMLNETFKQLGLSNHVLTSIETLGYQEPSKIQKEVIPLIMEGYDVIGQAQTGTGKTLAFAASILSKIDVRDNVIKALIIAPTRELALQISEEFEALNRSHHFHILSVFGGSSIELQMRALKKGVDIVVGTPGRIMDLMKRKALRLDELEYFVLDEADEMLNMGFEEDIKYIFEKTRTEKQVLLFSATMPKAILKLASNYMKPDYQHIVIESTSKTAANITQTYYLVNEKIRIEALCRILDLKSPKRSIIFCQRKSEVDELLTALSTRNYNAEAMHGDITQAMRIQTLNRFKEDGFQYLIATDVAARGIHVDHIDLVVNYNLPQDIESYIHRIGRTGRAGESGEAVSLVTPSGVNFLKDVEQKANCTIERKEFPNKEEIYNSKRERLFAQIEGIVEGGDYQDTMEYIRDFNKDQLMKYSASLLHLLLEKEIGSNFNKELHVREDSRSRKTPGFTRVFLTIGKMDNLKRGTLLDFLKAKTNIPKEHFQNIDIVSKFTFMDVKNESVDICMSKIYNQKLNDRVIRIEKAKKK